jgi:hypothetical protein
LCSSLRSGPLLGYTAAPTCLCSLDGAGGTRNSVSVVFRPDAASLPAPGEMQRRPQLGAAFALTGGFLIGLGRRGDLPVGLVRVRLEQLGD